MSSDAVIVGAGIVGAACALECSRAGMSVTVVDSGETGGGATAAAMGHVVVMDDSEAQFALTQFSRDLWAELAPQLPDNAEFEKRGTVWIAADEEEMAEVVRKQKFFTSRGVKCELLDTTQLAAAEPNLRRGLTGALLVHDDCVVNPAAVSVELIRRSKARIVQSRAVAIEARRVMLQDGGSIEAGVTINAAGIGAGALMPSCPIAIRPRKGHLFLTEASPGFANHQLVELGYLKSAHALDGASSVAFNLQPRQNGQMLVGSSRQFGADYPEIDASVMGDMLQRASEYMPGIVGLRQVRAWTGFRGATPDKLPLIGPVPQIETAYVAAGHEGLGITTSLGTARILVDFIQGKTPQIPIEPYFPDRKHE